ncbi:hypothetical protein [Portibacter lacus]|uniref:Lipocalin-like domain-containing protein n=1 Tax=Portibacter lacus TaxID=1099794 RepID=A0AA37WFK4_9BACT|nr:hypothetical protein [Portibacter lacus]GLR20156.1 hypothetical protein GCM10007940_47720 [Portibacter lacus]
MKYFIFSVLIICVACKTDSTTDNKDKVVPAASSQKAAPQSSDNIEKSTLTNNSWIVEIVLDNGQISANNNWIESIVEFKENGSYSWKGEGFSNLGKYNLDLNKNIVLLESDNPDLNSEWSIKHNKAMMVWIGTPKFGHHAMQLKLVKKSSNLEK